MVISGTVIGIIWLFMYTPNPNIGLLNALFHINKSWLGDPKLVNFSLMVSWIWSQVGMSVIIIAAALKGVPAALMDAAEVDGANKWQRFIHITIPSIKIPMSFLLITQLIQVLKVFDVVFVMTGGGPAGISRTLAVMFYEQSFTFLKPQYGATVVIVMSIIAIVAYKITGNMENGKEA